MKTVYQKEFDTAQRAARLAGATIAKYYGKKFDITHKRVDHPLTQADLEANQIIKEMIRREFPQDGWLSEEDVDSVARLEKKRVWIVDPLDGTKDFINQNPEFAVSVALSENEEPVVGVVYNPITREVFSAVKGSGAFCGDNPIHVKKYEPGEKIQLLVSRSEFKRGEWQKFSHLFHLSPSGGCAYKMAKIAQGKADGTFTLRPKSEWDICAGTLIVQEAGGVVCDLGGALIKFNQESLMRDGLIYCNGDEVKAQILKNIGVVPTV